LSTPSGKESESKKREESQVAEKEKKDKEEKTPFDALLKHLTDLFGRELVAYLGGFEEIESCESVGGEVEMVHRLSDRVFRVEVAGEQGSETFLVHLEFEAEYSTTMGQRLGMYGWGLMQQEKLPVVHLVWYVSEKAPSYWPEGKWHRLCNEEMKVGGEVRSWVNWREIWLPGKYTAAEFIEEAPPYLLPFAALMKGVDRPFIPTLTELILKAELPESIRQDLLVMALFFLARILGLGAVKEDTYMNLIEQNPLAEYLIQKGHKEGREEGRKEALRETLERLATKRFGPLPSAVSEQLAQMPASKLEPLLDGILDLPDLEAFTKALS